MAVQCHVCAALEPQTTALRDPIIPSPGPKLAITAGSFLLNFHNRGLVLEVLVAALQLASFGFRRFCPSVISLGFYPADCRYFLREVLQAYGEFPPWRTVVFQRTETWPEECGHDLKPRPQRGESGTWGSTPSPEQLDRVANCEPKSPSLFRGKDVCW
jgi:hypothetical protein